MPTRYSALAGGLLMSLPMLLSASPGPAQETWQRSVDPRYQQREEAYRPDAAPQRYDAPGERLKGNKYSIVGTLTDQFDMAKGKANAEDAIARYPDLGCMVGLFAYNPPLCLEALKQSGKAGKIKLVAFDEADETLQAIKDGICHGTVVQNPYMYGMESVRVLSALARGPYRRP